MSEQKNGKNLPPRWHSWATESTPVTTYLWVFWGKQTSITQGSVSQGFCYFQLKTFLIDAFQSYIGQASDPFHQTPLPPSLPRFRMPTASPAQLLPVSWTIQSPPLGKLFWFLSVFLKQFGNTSHKAHSTWVAMYVPVDPFRFWYIFEGQRPQPLPHLSAQVWSGLWLGAGGRS